MNTPMDKAPMQTPDKFVWVVCKYTSGIFRVLRETGTKYVCEPKIVAGDGWISTNGYVDKSKCVECISVDQFWELDASHKQMKDEIQSINASARDNIRKAEQRQAERLAAILSAKATQP
jgi:hypothetical protein